MNNQEVIEGDENTVTRLALLLSGKFLDDKLSVSFNTKNAFNQDAYKPNVTLTAASLDPTNRFIIKLMKNLAGILNMEALV